MATKNLVPRADNEGKLGLRDTTPKRRWLESNAVSGSFDYLRTDELKNLSNFDLLEAGDNITIAREEDANEGWRYKISSTASGGSSAETHRIFADDTGTRSEVLVSDDNTQSNTFINFKLDGNDQWRISKTSSNEFPFLPMTDASDLGSITNEVRSLYVKNTASSGESFGINFSDGTEWKSNLSLSSTNRLRFSSTKDGSNLVFDNIPVFKEPVKVATKENLNYTYNSSTGELTEVATTGTLSIDGITSFVVGDRILVKNQTSSVHNGLYKVKTMTTSSSVVLERDIDLKVGEDFENIIVFALQGTKNSGTCFISRPDGVTANTVGSHNLNWSTTTSRGIESVSEDTAPSLGGDLNVGTNSIKSSSSSIKFLPGSQTLNGTEISDGLVSINNNSTSGSELRLYTNNSSSSNLYVSIKAPENSSNSIFANNSNITLNLPTHDGSNNNTLATEEWVDLRGYATESWVGIQGFITSSSLNGYATESWVGSQGFITNLTNYSTTTQMNAAIDSKISGFDEILTPVKAATEQNLGFTYNNSSQTLTGSGTSLVVDTSYTVSAGDRILVKNQADKKHNGVYTVTALTPAVVLTRADFVSNPAAAIDTKFVFVEDGASNKDSGFISSGTGNVGAVDLEFRKFSSAANFSAGLGLSQIGNTISAKLKSAGGLAVSTDGLSIATSGVTNAMLAGSIADTKLSKITTSDKIGITAIDIDGGTELSSDTLKSTGLIIADIDGQGNNRKVKISELSNVIFGSSSNNVSSWGLNIGSGGEVYLDSGGSSPLLKIVDSKVTTSKLADGSVSSSKLNSNLITGITNTITATNLKINRSSTRLLVEYNNALYKPTISDLLTDVLNIDSYPTYASASQTISKDNDMLVVYDLDKQVHRKASVSEIVSAAADAITSTSNLTFETFDYSNNHLPGTNNYSNNEPLSTDGEDLISNRVHTVIQRSNAGFSTASGGYVHRFNLPAINNIHSKTGDLIIIRFQIKDHPNQSNNISTTTSTFQTKYGDKHSFGLHGRLDIRPKSGSGTLASYDINKLVNGEVLLRFNGTEWLLPSTVTKEEIHHTPATTLILATGGVSLWGKTVLFTAEQETPRTIYLPPPDFAIHGKSSMRIISWGKSQTFTINTGDGSESILDHKNSPGNSVSPSLSKSITINSGPGIIEIIYSNLNITAGSNGTHNFQCWVISYPESGTFTTQTFLTAMKGSPQSGDSGLNDKIPTFQSNSPTVIEARKVYTNLIEDSAITTGKILDDAISSGKLQSSAVVTAKISDSAVIASKIADNAVVTSKILDDNITKAKIEKISPYKILGNVPQDPTVSNSNANPLETTVDVELDAQNVAGNHSSIATTRAIKSYVIQKLQDFQPSATSDQYKYITFNESTPPGQIYSVSANDFIGDTAHVVVKNERWRRNLSVNKINPSSESWANKAPTARYKDTSTDGFFQGRYPVYPVMSGGYQQLMGIELPKTSNITPGIKICFYYISTINTSSLDTSLTGSYTHIPGNIKLFTNKNDKIYQNFNEKYVAYNLHNPNNTHGYSDKFQVDLSDSSIYDSSKSEQENMITIYNSIKSAITSINLPRTGLHVYNTYNAMQSIMVPKGFRDFSDTSLITSNLKEATFIRSYTGRLPYQSGLMGLTNHHSSSYSRNNGADSGYIQYFRGPGMGAPRRFPSSTQQNTHCVKNTYELVHERNLGVTWRFMLAEVVEIPSTIS
jgi:hypothetical protein